MKNSSLPKSILKNSRPKMVNFIIKSIGKSYFQKLIDIPHELKEDGDESEIHCPMIDEEEPELPSDSYFIMILPENGKCGGESSITSEDEYSREVSSSESSLSKRKYSNTTDNPKNLFYMKGDCGKKSGRGKTKPSSAESKKAPEIRLPLIMSGSIAND